MRTHGAAMTAHLAGYAHTRCNMLLLELVDGTVIGMTDHDQDLPFDLGDGVVSYSAAGGMLLSDLVLACGLDAPNYEATLPLGVVLPELAEGVTLPAVTGKRYNMARATRFQVNWADLTQGASIDLVGLVHDQHIEGSTAVLEVRGLAAAYNQVVGEVTTLTCKADFGDARCKMVRTTFDTEVVSASSPFQLVVDVTGIPDIPFAFGGLQFTSGALDGTQEMELFTFDQVTGAIQLLVPLAATPEAGDQLTIFNGCSKLKSSVDAALPTCLFYENVINFRGEDQQPGSDMYQKFAVPGSSGS